MDTCEELRKEGKKRRRKRERERERERLTLANGKR